MTRDEVMALSDDELRNKAAELAGWRMLTFSDNTSPWRVQGINPTNGQLEPTPDYPHDIAAAWELVEYVLALHREWWADVQSNHSGLRWDAGFGDYVGIECYTAEGDTAPLAITRAFVLAKTGGQTEADTEAGTMSESGNESGQRCPIDEVMLASCRNRAMNIVWGSEGDELTAKGVRARLEYEYGVDVCRAAFASESELGGRDAGK